MKNKFNIGDKVLYVSSDLIHGIGAFKIAAIDEENGVYVYRCGNSCNCKVTGLSMKLATQKNLEELRREAIIGLHGQFNGLKAHFCYEDNSVECW